MKKLNKLVKSVFTLIIAAAIIVGTTVGVKAAANTISLGNATKTGSYIAGVSFSYKKTTDGKYLYCLNMHKNTAKNVNAKLIKNSKYINGGIVYILKNGYPNKSITGDKDKDYYITQTAVWWYLDKTTGSQNLGDQFKSNGSDSYGLRKYVKNLVNEGYKHRNDPIGFSDTKLIINTTGTNDLKLDKDYYVSSNIKATTMKNVSTYTVTLSNAPAGTKIVKSDGSESTYEKGFNIQGNESFKIKVPAKSVTGTITSIKVNATTKGEKQYMAYEYQPVDSTMQNVALLESRQQSAESALTLEIASSKVTILKVDTNTKQPIAGAKLLLRDASGNEITSWTSTTNAHIIRNLANGKYTLEEVSAPTGYLLNTNKTNFEITDTNRDITINFENAPKKVVVNIIKVDQATNAPLAGAVLVVKDSTGKEIANFTTTTEPYVLTDLENGVYTVEEVSAPAGYMTSNEKITFTIDDEHLSHQITFINAKETFVPDTASVSSIIMLILGIVITGFGIRFIYKNGQRA